MNTFSIRKLLGLLIAALFAGCSAYPVMEADFGNSVRHLVRSQKVYPGVVDTSPVQQGDGQRIENVIGAYRDNVSKPDEVEQPLVIDLGSN